MPTEPDELVRRAAPLQLGVISPCCGCAVSPELQMAWEGGGLEAERGGRPLLSLPPVGSVRDGTCRLTPPLRPPSGSRVTFGSMMENLSSILPWLVHPGGWAWTASLPERTALELRWLCVAASGLTQRPLRRSAGTGLARRVRGL